jgi:hypothetical protein
MVHLNKPQTTITRGVPAGRSDSIRRQAKPREIAQQTPLKWIVRLLLLAPLQRTVLLAPGLADHDGTTAGSILFSSDAEQMHPLFVSGTTALTTDREQHHTECQHSKFQ